MNLPRKPLFLNTQCRSTCAIAPNKDFFPVPAPAGALAGAFGLAPKSPPSSSSSAKSDLGGGAAGLGAWTGGACGGGGKRGDVMASRG